MGGVNKATVSVVLGAISTVVQNLFDVPADVTAAVTTALVSFFVWLVPNKA